MGRHANHMGDADVRLLTWVAVVVSMALCLVTCPALAWASEQDGGVPTDEARVALGTELAWEAEHGEVASADPVQASPEDEPVAPESCDVQASGDAQGQAEGEATTQIPDEGFGQADLVVQVPDAVQAPADEMRAATAPDTPASSFTYTHDPRDNHKAMADIVEDVAAIYGFRPSTEGSLAAYAGMDWTDPVVVEGGRRERIAYHESIAEMYEMLYEMQAAGASTEQIARAVSAKRNEIRIASYANNPEGLAQLKARNLELYGNENGGSPEYFYERYGSWETVIDKSFSTNSGMDACLGLYDDYYALYVILGQVEPDPVEPSPVEPDPLEGDDQTDEGEQADNRDDGGEADDVTDEDQPYTSTHEGQVHTATVTTGVGHEAPSESVQAVAHATQALPATGDGDVCLPLDLALAGGLLVGLGMRLRRNVAAHVRPARTTTATPL